LWQTIEPSLLVHYRSYTTYYDIWQKAKNVYSNDIQRLYGVIHNLATLKMIEDNITNYANKAQSAVTEFKLLVTDNDPKKMLDKLDNVCMVYVLHGLHENYESVMSNILSASDIPSAEDLIRRLTRLPGPKGLGGNMSHTDMESSAFVSNFAGRGGRGLSRRGGRGGRPQCTYCKRFGHYEKSVNVAQSIDNGNTKKNVISDEEYKSYIQFKASQASSSATIAHTGNSTVCLSQSSSVGPWILDPGDSDHVAGNPSLLSKITQPKIPHHITIVDGSKAKASGVGQATPLPSLNLDYVLFVFNCPFNLIYVSRLTKSLNCSITFTSDSFVIQDRSAKQMIGAGYESHGLYYLQSSSTIASSSTTESSSLLHRRLGHPSLKKFRVMVPHLSQL